MRLAFLSSGGAGVAPACALADAFAKASAHASSGPVIPVIFRLAQREQNAQDVGPVPPPGP